MTSVTMPALFKVPSATQQTPPAVRKAPARRTQKTGTNRSVVLEITALRFQAHIADHPEVGKEDLDAASAMLAKLVPAYLTCLARRDVRLLSSEAFCSECQIWIEPGDSSSFDVTEEEFIAQIESRAVCAPLSLRISGNETLGIAGNPKLAGAILSIFRACTKELHIALVLGRPLCPECWDALDKKAEQAHQHGLTALGPKVAQMIERQKKESAAWRRAQQAAQQ